MTPSVLLKFYPTSTWWRQQHLFELGNHLLKYALSSRRAQQFTGLPLCFELLRILCDLKGGFESSVQYEGRFWEFCAIWGEVLRVLWIWKEVLRVLCDVEWGFESSVKYERKFWVFCETWKEVLRVLCDMKGFMTFLQHETKFNKFWEIWNVILKVHPGDSCKKITCLCRSMVLRDCNYHFFTSRLTSLTKSAFVLFNALFVMMML